MLDGLPSGSKSLHVHAVRVQHINFLTGQGQQSVLYAVPLPAYHPPVLLKVSRALHSAGSFSLTPRACRWPSPPEVPPPPCRSPPGYCLVGKVLPPPGVGGWVGVEMGGWVSPKFQHFGPPGPPPRGAGVLFFGFQLCRALRPV